MRVELVGINSPGVNQALSLTYLKSYFIKNEAIQNKLSLSIQNFSTRQSSEFICSKIYKQMPDILGFSCYMWNKEKVLELCQMMKAVLPKMILILGGPEPSVADKLFLQQNKEIDILIKGEGEVSFSELLNNLVSGKAINDILGITYRKGEHIIQNELRPQILDLDDIPSPYLNGILSLKKEQNQMFWEISRGCPFKCGFCADHKNFKRLAFVSMGRIEEEIRLLTAQTNLQRIWVLDSTFNFNPERAKKIIRLIKKYNKNNIQFVVETRAEFTDEEMAKLFNEANIGVDIGLQTIHKTTMKNINRITKMDTLQQKIFILNKNSVDYKIDLIAGLPGDNYETFKSGVDYLISQNTNALGLFTLSVLPGTPIFNHAEKFKIKFLRKAPYDILSNYTFSYDDLFRAKILIKSIKIFHRPVLFGIIKKFIKTLDTLPSHFFESWFQWLNNKIRITQEDYITQDFDNLFPLRKKYFIFEKFFSDILSKYRKEEFILPLNDIFTFFYLHEKISRIKKYGVKEPSHIKNNNILGLTVELNSIIRRFGYNFKGLLDEKQNEPFDFKLIKKEPWYVLILIKKGSVQSFTISSQTYEILKSCNGKKNISDIIKTFARGNKYQIRKIQEKTIPFFISAINNQFLSMKAHHDVSHSQKKQSKVNNRW